MHMSIIIHEIMQSVIAIHIKQPSYFIPLYFLPYVREKTGTQATIIHTMIRFVILLYDCQIVLSYVESCTMKNKIVKLMQFTSI